VCRGCGSVEELPTASLNQLVDQLQGTKGFLLDIGHVALFGLCAGCAGEEPAC
jgi:Fur family ferric uptake transcriptional regulator